MFNTELNRGVKGSKRQRDARAVEIKRKMEERKEDTVYGDALFLNGCLLDENRASLTPRGLMELL